MAVSVGNLLRPPLTADYRSKSSQLRAGLLLVAVGLGVAMVAFISSFIQAGRDGTAVEIATQAAWTFGVATAALGIIKSGIAVALWGIVRRLWIRVQSVKEALPSLVPQNNEAVQIQQGLITTPYGRGRTTLKAPAALPIHRMAYALWTPMLVMGAMGVGIGLGAVPLRGSGSQLRRYQHLPNASGAGPGHRVFG